MTSALSIERPASAATWLLLIAGVIALLAVAQPAVSANILEEDAPSGAPSQPGYGSEAHGRVVVAPEPPHWSGWSGFNERWPDRHRSAPRIRLWVDRGEWSTYEPGDRMWVYFRVDRPCYVTIMDYSPDGRVDVLYPNRWSGSTFVSPGRTYRVPESRGYSLRIAGPGGVETLVACAHEAPWPSGPGGVWIPRHRPYRGRVVVGRPGRSPLPGWPGRIVVSPRHWPVPPAWYDRRERWSCDSVSFYVSGWSGGDWYDGGWAPGSHDSHWYHDGDWDRGGREGALLLSDHFVMRKCADSFSRNLRLGDREVSLGIDCVESSNGGPTEIVGRLFPGGRREGDTLFRIDVEGEHGERPQRGSTFAGRSGPFYYYVEITDFELSNDKHWQIPRLKRIEFDLRIYDGR